MDDDDLGDQGKKSNASPVHKPEHSKQYDVAPRGSVGRAPGGFPGQISRPSQAKSPEHDAEPKIQFRRNPEQSQATDNRPIAVETGDKAVDQESLAKGQQLKTEEEINKLAHPEKDKAKSAQERSGDRFKETDDPEVNAFYQKTDDMVSRVDARFKKAQEIAAKFAKDKSKDHDLGH